MTNVKEFREFLAHLPDDAVVRVLTEVTCGYDTTTKWVNLTLPATPEQAGYGDDLCLWGPNGQPKYLDLGRN